VSLWEEQQAAASEAQDILAQITGMAEGAAGNTQIAGTNQIVTGVYGRPEVDFIPQPGGGYRKRTILPLTITREQMPEPVKANTKLTRIDLTPNVTYNVEKVDTQDPLVWTLTLINHAG
jgi:hypothetical protein